MIFIYKKNLIWVPQLWSWPAPSFSQRLPSQASYSLFKKWGNICTFKLQSKYIYYLIWIKLVSGYRNWKCGVGWEYIAERPEFYPFPLFKDYFDAYLLGKNNSCNFSYIRGTFIWDIPELSKRDFVFSRLQEWHF